MMGSQPSCMAQPNVFLHSGNASRKGIISIANQKLRLSANDFGVLLSLLLYFTLGYIRLHLHKTQHQYKPKYLVTAHAYIGFTEVKDYTTTH